MLRTITARPILKGLIKGTSTRSTYNAAAAACNANITYRSLSSKRPQVVTSSPFRPTTTSSLRYATSSKPPFDKIDHEAESKVLKQKVASGPVSEVSSTRSVFEGKAEGADKPKGDHDADMLGGIKADLRTIRDTFALGDVPRESYYLGLAGTLPYLATSLSTVYLAWDINHATGPAGGFLFTPEVAHQLLLIVEPIQIGYGAVILSFLGAIHWGLEYAGYGGHQGYRRYMIGVVAPAVAWPTMLMPIEYALITQFLAFNFLYFADTRQAVKGFAPPWYGTYRFVLTFIVGASIVVSLIGRGQIVRKDHTLPGPAEKMQALRDSQWAALEKEEKERQKKMANPVTGTDDHEEEPEAPKDEPEDEGDENAKDTKDAKAKDTKDAKAE